MGQVGVHLLATPGLGEAWVVDALRAAATSAGTPEAAMTFLRRALTEPPPTRAHAVIVAELGRAEALAHDPQGIARLREAVELAESPEAKAWLVLPLMTALVEHGLTEEMSTVAAEAAAWVGRDRDLRCRLEALAVHAALMLGNLDEAHYQDLFADCGEDRSHGALMLRASLAFAATHVGVGADEVAKLAADALRDGELIEAAAEDPLSFLMAIFGLEFSDRLDAAAACLGAAIDAARRSGSPGQYMIASSARAAVLARGGALEDAEADARGALEIADAYKLLYTVPVSVGALILALVGRGDLDGAEQALARYPVDPEHVVPYDLAFHRFAVAQLRLAQRRFGEALEGFTEARAVMTAINIDHPAFYPWRSGAAMAKLALGDAAAARALAEAEVEMARAYGAARPLGVALRTLGLAYGSVEVLAESAEVLRASPARLELAATLVELGAALRRAGRIIDAREPLREALDLSAARGAALIESRAREELIAAGGKPRRHRTSGVDALTASELRTARLAAAGHTNRGIAQELFITVKTVEKHLQSVYRKLEIDSRQKLGVLPL